MDKAREADTIVDSLGKAMQSGEAGLRYVPALLLRVINEGLWRDRVIAKTGERVTFERFVDFVRTDPLEGLGADIDTLKRLCAAEPAALDALDRATQRTRSDNQLLNNVKKLEQPEGNSRATALRRLRKDRPDLHARVLAKEISPNAAMVAAGFRDKTLTIPLDVERAAATLRRHFTADERAQLADLLMDADD